MEQASQALGSVNPKQAALTMLLAEYFGWIRLFQSRYAA